jgi:hypothetical protein
MAGLLETIGNMMSGAAMGWNDPSAPLRFRIEQQRMAEEKRRHDEQLSMQRDQMVRQNRLADLQEKIHNATLLDAEQKRTLANMPMSGILT